MSEPVQLEEKKSGKSRVSKQSKKSANTPQNKEGQANNNNNNSNNNNEETKTLENKPIVPQLSTRAYLEQNVTPVVQEALLECARKRPNNPLEFVGNYILERAHGK